MGFLLALYSIELLLTIRICGISRFQRAHRRSRGYGLDAIHLLQFLAQETLGQFSLPPLLPATRAQTKALLQSVLADKRSQKNAT